MEQQNELEGLIENVVFQSDDNRFCVFKVNSKENGTFSVVYKGPAPCVGEEVSLKGKWVEHPRFGKQFQAEFWQAKKITSPDGVERFLASGAIKGIGKAMAHRIVEHFGSDTMGILGTDPYKLQEVNGIGKKKAEDIVASYASLSDMRE